MTPTHDTAAALEAAIRTFGVCAYSPSEPSDPYGIAGAHIWIEIEDYAAPLKAAITAYVEAEVARRLAAAPDVEVELDSLRPNLTGGATLDYLRAAIAADKARAVTAVISPAVHELRNALPPVRHHAQRIEPGDRREAILRGVDRALAVADELAAVLDGGPPPAGPTPDEARRLVEAFEQVCDMWQYREAAARTTARDALIAALVGKDP